MNVFDRVLTAVRAFDPESVTLGVARTGLASAQLLLLVVTGPAHLFVPVLGQEEAPACSSWVQRTSAFCLGEGLLGLDLVRWLVVAGLVLVASGFMPRLTGVLHYWLTLSISTSIALPDGGEAVAQVVTLFLMLIALNDRRRWHWRPGDGGATARPLNGLAWAALWGLRLQMAYIYINSSVTKLAVDAWAEGTALFYITRGAFFGADNPLAPLVLWATENSVLTLALTWGTIVGEGAIGVLLLAGRVPGRRLALVLSASLHLGIIAVIGLWTFGIIMVSAVLAAAAPEVDLPRAVRRVRAPSRPARQDETQTSAAAASAGTAQPEPETASPPRSGAAEDAEAGAGTPTRG